MKRSSYLLMVLTLSAPFYSQGGQPIDIELLEFIGLWEPDSDSSNPHSNTANSNHKPSVGSWRDPFAIPQSDPSTQKPETTESL